MLEQVNNDPYRPEDDSSEKDPILNKAYAIISVALIVGVFFLYKYFRAKGDFLFESKDGLGDLGSILAGTAGILVTLGGIYFIRKTIEQTRTEMKQTREIMLTQMAETTFFNLLQNHKEVVIGDFDRKKEFEQEIRKIKSGIKKYKKAIVSKNFESFGDTENHPAIIVRRSQLCFEISKSIIHIIEFISNRKLKKKSFFYETLKINLTSEESYLIGLVLYYKLYPVKINEKYGEIFTRYLYREPEYLYSDVEGYFPSIRCEHFIAGNINLPADWRTNLNESFFENYCKCSIKGETEVVFYKLKYKVEYTPGTGRFRTINTKNFEGEMGASRYFSLANFMNDKIIPCIKESNLVSVGFTFCCKYKEEDYKFSFHCVFQYEESASFPIPEGGVKNGVECKLRLNFHGAM